jgi:hypothetical protein
MALGLTSSITSGILHRMTVEKVAENLVRRMAERQGFTLQRSRRRDPQSIDFGMYWLNNDEINARIFPSGPGSETGVTLDEIRQWLDEPVAAPRERRLTDEEVKPYLGHACLVDIDRGTFTGVLVREKTGKYRMKKLLGPLENQAYIVDFAVSEIRRVRRLELPRTR